MSARALNTSVEWDDLLGAYRTDVQEIALAARRLIFAAIPNIEETVDAKAKVVGYGFGRGYADMICTIILSKTGVKLGLVGGAKLPDPERLLKGAGRVHRYLPLAQASELSKPATRALLASGVTAWKKKSGTR